MLIFQKKNIPNLISIIRIFLSLIAVVFYFLTNHSSDIVVYSWEITALNLKFPITKFLMTASAFFAVAGLTDFLDGYLARKWNVVSDFGKIMDPISDKILLNGTMIALAVNGIISGWIITILILRDILLNGIRMFSISKNHVIAANIWGKLKTVFQITGVLVVGLIFSAPIQTYSANNLYFYYLVQNLFFVLATIVSIYSFWVYFYKFLKINKLKNVS